MVSRMCSSLVAVRVTVAYAVTLLLVATTLLVLGPRVQDRVVSHLSTNLHNLAHGHLGTLVGSAFVTADGQVYVLLPGLVCLLALAELLWRSGRLVLAFALGHIGATLIVAVGLAADQDRLAADLDRPRRRRRAQLRRDGRAGHPDRGDTAALAPGLDWRVAGRRPGGRGVRGGLHGSRAHGRPDAGHAAVHPVPVGHALDTGAIGAAGGWCRGRLPDA